jgi:hypothetical protein
MLDTNQFAEAADAIRAALALTEGTFLKVGKALEESIEILARLSEGFDILLTELKSEELDQALRSLADAAANVTELGRTRSGENAGFDHLRQLTDAVAARIMKMYASVKAVASLSICAKLATTDVRTSSLDFSSFSDDITRILNMTRSSLDSFTAELSPLRERVIAARAVQLVSEKRQDEAVRSIPMRLRATVSSIHMQHRHAATASSAVARRSEGVRQEICKAVMALQIGDIVRQRLEHSNAALSLMNKTLESLARTGQHVAVDGINLDAEECRAFADTACCLQSAQLSDCAQAFDREVDQIIASLTTLSAEALALRNLGSAAYGSSNRDHSTFVAELDVQVGEALELLTGFGTAKADTACVVTSVSDATERLCGHLATVQSLEADIRIMSLNTTLKCSRAGREGLALSLIAQELRSYANGFAKEAGAIMGEVGNISKVTGSFIQGGDAELAEAIGGSMRAMQGSLATLRRVGQTLGHALASLELDSDRVMSLLARTVVELESHNEIGQTLRQAASALTEMSAHHALPLADPRRHVERMLDLLARNYTMAAERRVHDLALGRPAEDPSGLPAIAGNELEDLLF